MARIDNFLQLMNERGASDLHFCVGRAPAFRLHGEIEPIRYKALSKADYDMFIGEITPKALFTRFKETGDVDFAYECEGLARFRVNLFKQERGAGSVFRIIPTKLFTIEQLGLPPVIREVVKLRKGLVLVTGPTGSGKSTTLSAIINEINETRRLHIVTVEDPIEFVHPNKKCVLRQREVGPHVLTFSDGLRAALREDPDIVLVGEMRDLETISLALHAAETGLLVFGTLHTNTAAKTVDRIVSVFPSDEQDGVRGVIADVIQCVFSQQLLKRKEERGRVAAIEVLFGSPALSSMIREGKIYQIPDLIRQGSSRGMVAMDDSLFELTRDNMVDGEAGYEKAVDKSEFRKRCYRELQLKVGADDEDPARLERELLEAVGADRI